jgi:hypothetical protein
MRLHHILALYAPLYALLVKLLLQLVFQPMDAILVYFLIPL